MQTRPVLLLALFTAGCVHNPKSVAPQGIDEIMAAETAKLPQPPCADGLVESGGIASSGAIYPSGCRTPQEKRDTDLWFAREMCEGEVGQAMFSHSADGTSVSWDNGAKWVNDHCEFKDTFRIGDREVTKAEFEKAHPAKCEPGWVQDGAWCIAQSLSTTQTH